MKYRKLNLNAIDYVKTRALTISFALFQFFTSFLGAQVVQDVLVKESIIGFSILVEDGVSFPLPSSLQSTMLVSFAPTTRNVTIAPGSGDPNTVTANPILINQCLCDPNLDGQLDACFDVLFSSLRDLGEWTISFPAGSLQFDPFNCVGDACNFNCDINTAGVSNNAVTFVLTVFNDPPTANITESSSPRWNETLQLDANSNDPDGGSVSHSWSIISRPPGSTATLTNSSSEVASITFSDEDDIGDWEFQVHVDDDEGERKTFTHSLNVPNEEPNITIQGNATIDALEDIALSAVNQGAANPGQDIDGGNLTFLWEILDAPAGGNFTVGHSWNTREISFTTTENDITTIDGFDIGIYTFRVAATDNEGDDDSAEVDVRVNNIPPEIELFGDEEIDVGFDIQVGTSILTDEDGGDLEFSWNLIQTPDRSPTAPQSTFSTSDVLTISTNDDDAGTWVIELEATDNEGETVSERITVLVDGPPEAVINGPDEIGSLSFPLVLDGSDSEDADSPCNAPNFCHTTSDPPVVISPGIVQYEWYLVDFPFEYFDEYFAGRVDEIFGIGANGPSISLGFGHLKPGDWQFELVVYDAEGNEDSQIFFVTVIDEDGPPFVFISPPQTQLTDITGLITNDIVISGVESFDLDNILAGDVLAPGLGITNYNWSYVSVPPGCTPPALPSAGSTSTFNLFTNGQFVTPECLGTYVINLEVTDDDATARTANGQTSVTIYNCPTSLCIVYPTNFVPEFIEFNENTNVLIYYNLNSIIYDEPAFLSGLVAKLELFHESDPTTPVYTDYDPNLLGSDKGGVLAFHWDGFFDDNSRPISGLYHISISLEDHLFNTSAITATELDAIWIEVVDPIIEPTTTLYIDHDDLSIGAEPVVIDYSFSGASPDILRWRIYDASSTVILEEDLGGPFSGSINWNGIDASATPVPPGVYEIELEALRGTDILGTSERFTFYVYDLKVTSPAGNLSTTAPGLYMMVNSDDDNKNNIVDSNESMALEDDLIQFDIEVLPADLPGEFTLSATNAATTKAWTSATKASEIVLPNNTMMPASTPPATVYIEGRQAGESNLKLSFTATDGILLNDEEATLTFVELTFMEDTNGDHAITAADNPVLFTKIANWENGYDAGFAVRNNADPDNFVERDASRFYISVSDPSANTDPATAEQIQVALEVLNSDGTIRDNATNQELRETGSNTGIFVSISQLLTSHDIQVLDDADADDEFAASDGTAATANDDTLNDRTHQANIDAEVRLSYTPTGAAAPFQPVAAVYERGANDYRRRVEIEVHVFNEPYQDHGIDGMPGTGDAGEGDGAFSFTDTNVNGTHEAGEPSEPYIDYSHGGMVLLSGSDVGVADGRSAIADAATVQAQINRSDIAWAQAGIKTDLLSTSFDDAPVVGGIDILLDGSNSIAGGGTTDSEEIFNDYTAAMSNDVLKVFFTGFLPGANAIQYRPGYQPFAHGDKVFILLAPNLNINLRTLAHELGHVLINTPDAATTQIEFFPASVTRTDDAINTYRRLLQANINNARTTRPAGNLNATGNTLLKN